MQDEQIPNYLCYIHPDESKEHSVHQIIQAEPVTVNTFPIHSSSTASLRYLKEYQRTFAILERSQPVCQRLSTSTFKFENTIRNYSRIHIYERFYPDTSSDTPFHSLHLIFPHSEYILFLFTT